MSRTPRWSRPRGAHAGPLTIGLINNMPDAALKSTERQFRELIADAAGGRPVAVRTFSFPALPRSERGRQYIRENHEDVAGFCRKMSSYKMRAAIVVAGILDAETAGKITPVSTLLASLAAPAQP